jgi:Holliday junction DNA helicase RuvA
MLNYIRGTLTHSSPTQITLEIQGLGYLLYIPLSHYAKLPQLGSEVLVYVTTVIREDSQKRFGFLSSLERDLFEKLNEVSGIGPKTALALIGHIDISDLQFAIAQGNAGLISKVPGIGKKTAERLIIELRDKIKLLEQKSFESDASFPKEEQNVIADAINALIHLGYAPVQAQNAVKTAMGKTEEAPGLGQLITSALRHI